MTVLVEALLSRHTYWRVGGPAERLATVENTQELIDALPAALVLGNGSNLLVPDAGLRGTVVRLAGALRGLAVVAPGDLPPGIRELQPGEVVLRAGAGLHNSVLLARLDTLGLCGLGCLAGVPGTVGGAVAMNAGTALGEVADQLLAVEGVVGTPPIPRLLPRSALRTRYRHGDLPPGFVVTAAYFAATGDGLAAERERVAQHLARRRATQPLDQPSCGSVFRNPAGDFAGRLVESVGLKGHAIGGARISERHGNFIVNQGGASSLDVMRCIRLAFDTVLCETGVRLQPEVHVVGHWPPELWPLPAG